MQDDPGALGVSELERPAPKLQRGDRLGPYEVVEPLGAGGMGEVYRARDTKLQRDVAIKILPASVARDPDRLHRFSARRICSPSLNHPHIAAIYGLEESDGITALVMELVEGQTSPIASQRGRSRSTRRSRSRSRSLRHWKRRTSKASSIAT